MKTSELINELSAALAKAQAEIKDAVKDATNPHFRNEYASLASVLDAVRDPLSKNGLSVMQAPKIADPGMILVTRLAHSSGQWVESETPLMLVKQDMQGFGSALTYARRYALAALCGVSQVDDDAEGSVGRNKPPETKPQEQQPARQSAPVTPKVGNVTRVGSGWDNGRGRV